MEVAATDAPEAGRPWLSVHGLAEFVFCPRAGVIAAETDFTPDDHEVRLNLDFSLPTTPDEIDADLQRAMGRWWVMLGAAATLAIVAVVAVWFGRHLWAAGSAIALGLVVVPLQRRYAVVERLAQLRDQARSARPRSPDFDAGVRTKVDWWELLADGWMSIRNRDRYQDEILGLGGRPWRALRRGDLSLPAFRIRRSDDQAPLIRPQHVVRLAAYGRLIETHEGRRSPCGVLLFGDSYEGVAVPIEETAKRQFDDALTAARTTLAKVYKEEILPPPPAPELCTGCPWGKPRQYKQGTTEITGKGVFVPAFGTPTDDGRLYHSPCGDVFQWVPPHQLAQKLGLDD